MTDLPLDGVEARPGDIAVIGIACRFPGAPDPETYWRNLTAGVESVRVLPRDPGGADEGRVRAGAVLDGIEDFDAGFFGYSTREAELLDPQHRVFLECAWEAIEDAGYHPAALRGPVGVYGGTGLSTYLIHHVHPQRGSRGDSNFIDSMSDLQMAVAADRDYLASRVSYKLDLTGPALTVQAACATSLYAVHLACQALLNGECDTALAGAASIPVPQIEEYAYEPGMVFSPDGHCRAFDERAEGTVFGSGAGVVLLKPLQDALDDGDSVYAVIKGSAINNDGQRKVGYTATSVSGQVRVIRDALAVADVDPATIGYVEAHGTGTTIGDPIEVAALTEAYGTDPRGHRCGLGTVKTNIGHLGWAAGMAGLIKTVLALRHRTIPPSLHFRRPNPRIDFENSPFRVVTELTDWPAVGDTPRRAGVSAFGLGGANAHVILEEAPQPAPADEDTTDRRARLLPLSARTPHALAELAGRYAEFLAASPRQNLTDVAATASLGRTHHPCRATVVAGTAAEAAAHLAALAQGSHEPAAPRKATSPFTTAALFSGQGGEYLTMGRRLYLTEPVFKTALDACDEVLRDYLGAPVSEFLYATDEVAAIPLIRHAQPALFAVQTALYRLWESWGVRPTVMMGHSLGEYAAAWAAGVFSLEDGLRLVAERGRLLQSLPDNGSMAAVLAAEPTVLDLLGTGGEVAVAAVNGTANTVISGHSEAVRAACARLRAAGLETKELRISRAGHSALMDPVLDDFEKIVRTIELRRPRHTLISNLTGTVIGAEVTDPRYWRRHLREPVRFLDGLNTLAGLGVDAAVEMGAAPVLTGIAASALPDASVLWVPSLRPGQDDRAHVLAGLGALYEHGAPVAWEAVHREPFRRRHLPTYPFQRERHWIEAPASAPARRDDAVPAAPGWTDWLHDVEWREAAVTPAANAPADGVWLVCGGGAELHRGLADRLAARGGRVVRATHGTRFQRHSDEHWTLDFRSRDDVVRLLDRLDTPVRGVVDLLALEPAAAGDGSAAWSGSGLDVAGAGTLHLIQTLTERGPVPPRLWIVSRRAQAAGADVTDEGLWHAALWGMGRVAAIEHPELHCTRVDLDLPGDPEDDATALAAELAADRHETEVAHRAGRRLVARLVPRPEAASRPAHDISPKGTYLVTGGLRGVGLLAAERLAEAGAGRLVLLGRSGPDAASRTVLDRLRALGVEVVTARADVSDLARLREVLAETELPERPLRGIVHAAGVLDDGTLSQLTWDRFGRVLLPKAQGAWHLHRVTQERGDRLDLFVLFSSTTGLLGNSGQANHSAANAVLDALAHHRSAAGLPATTVNWGAWSDTGFLADRPDTREHLARIGMGGIDRRSGEALIDRAVRTDTVRLVVAPVNWPVFLEHHHLAETGFFTTLTGPAPTPRPEKNLAHRLGRSTPDERVGLLRAEVTRQLERILGRPADTANPEARDEPTLIELGMDSLSAIQVRNGLQRRLGVPLPANLCYAHPTPSRLVAHLAGLSYATAEAPEAPEAPAKAPAPAGTAGTGQALPSFQQRRWRSLIVQAEYGHRIVPIFIPAALDPVRLRESLVRVVARHDALRAVHPNPGEIRTVDAESAVPHLGDLVVTVDPAQGPREAIAAELRRLWAARPDVGASVSWTCRALATSDDEFALLLSLQHLDFDGTSISVFLDELTEEYTAPTAGRDRLGGPPPSYRSYARWQQERYSQRAAEANAYLRGLYGQITAPTLLPGRTTLETTGIRPSTRYTPDPSECLTTADLTEAARRIGASPFALVAAAYGRAVAERFELGEISVTSVFSGRTEERFERVVGPMTSHWPLPVPIGPRALPDAARAVGRTTAQLAELAAFCPVDSVLRAAPAFSGLPHHTYFSDVALNFTSYQRHGTTVLAPEVIEVLGPVSHPLLDPADFGGLAFPSGLHLIFDVSGEHATPSLWFHTDRFSPDVAAKVVDTMTGFLMQLKKGGE